MHAISANWYRAFLLHQSGRKNYLLYRSENKSLCFVKILIYFPKENMQNINSFTNVYK